MILSLIPIRGNHLKRKLMRQIYAMDIEAPVMTHLFCWRNIPSIAKPGSENTFCQPVRATPLASPPFGTLPLFFALFGCRFAPGWLERTITHTIPSLLVRRPFLPFPSSHSCIHTMWLTSVCILVPCRAGPLCTHLFLVLLHQLLRSFRVWACRAELPELCI
jgi:hypothetical protein